MKCEPVKGGVGDWTEGGLAVRGHEEEGGTELVVAILLPGLH
jgi:hypothetical protein